MIVGSGGGGKGGGGGGGGAKEAADSLRSKQYARVVDVVSEGEIVGLVNGLKSIYLDDVPIMNSDGSLNYDNTTVVSRVGLQDQDIVPGFSSGEAENGVGVEVKYETPVVRSIMDTNADAARITIAIPSLTTQDTSNGDLTGGSVSLSIAVQNNGGGYVSQVLSKQSFPLIWDGDILSTPDEVKNAIIEVNWEGVTLPASGYQTVTYRLDWRVSGGVWATLDSDSFSGTRGVSSDKFTIAPVGSRSFSFSKDVAATYEFRVVLVSGVGTLTLQGTGVSDSFSDTITGKTTSKYLRDYLIQLPAPGPWDIKVSRLTPNSTSSAVKNQTYWESYTTIVQSKLSYPNTAYFACSIDAEQFSSIPTRGYEIKGLLVKVPDNYDPLTREYTGVWTGNFKIAWTDNPAWCYYDLLTTPRYGLGSFISEDEVSKWDLYTIGQYCDEFVDTGFGGVEPRFTCNLYLQTREECFKVIQAMATIFRGMSYWGGGTINTIQDSPKDPIMLFNKSNIIDGEFAYSGTSGKQRHTVALVSWNDPVERYKQKIEYVEHQEGIAKYGIIQTEVVAVGCTSRGQAHRVGKWILYTEQMETETVSFRTGLEGFAEGVVPGEIIQTSDPIRAGLRLGGRVISATTTEVVLDADITIETGIDYVLWVTLPDGSVEQRDVITGIGTTNTLEVGVAFTDTPLAMSTWILSASNALPEEWRIISVTEAGENIVEINAIEYRSDKYAAVEEDLVLEPLNTSALSVKTDKPTNVTATEQLYLVTETIVGNSIVVSWTGEAATHIIQWRREEENWQTVETTEPSYSILNAQQGNYEIKVFAKNSIGIKSEAVLINVIAYGLTVPPEDVTGFSISAISSQAHLTWDTSPDLDVRIGGYMRIRFTPDKVSPSWNNSVDIGPEIPGTSRQTVLPLLDGTYLAKWIDSSGYQSNNAALIITEAANIQKLNFMEVSEQSPTFDGDKEQLSVTGFGLTLDSAGTIGEQSSLISTWPLLSTLGGIVSSGTYYFSSGLTPTFLTTEGGLVLTTEGGTQLTKERTAAGLVDLGSIQTCRLTARLITSGYSVGNTISIRGLVSSWPSVSGELSDRTEARLYVRTTNDDPYATPTWSDWTPFLVGDYSARGFDFKLEVATFDSTQNIAISELSVTIDMPDRVESGENISSTAGTYVVTYSLPFKTNPAVGISAQEMTTGDYYEVTSKSASGFSITFKNSGGTPVNRTFDYIAKGY